MFELAFGYSNEADRHGGERGDGPLGATGALAAIGVAGRINGFASMPAVGVLMGAQTLIGYNYGARHWKRVRQSYWPGVLFATCIITFLA